MYIFVIICKALKYYNQNIAFFKSQNPNSTADMRGREQNDLLYIYQNLFVSTSACMLNRVFGDCGTKLKGELKQVNLLS